MAASPLRSRPIPSIIQGVSQQTPQQRRDAQCEAQQDCINSPTLGVVARNGCDIQAFVAALHLTNPYVYEILRGSSEHYLVILNGGQLQVWDLNTFTLCALSGSSAYLHSTAGVDDRDNFKIQSVGDFHFFINRSISPQLDPASVSANPNPAAIVFFEAGNYLTTYVVTVEFSGNLYTFSYQTPDNSVPGNFAYIQTNQLAATFYRAMTGSVATGGGTGKGVGSSGFDGSTGTGYTTGAGSGNVTGTTTLGALGFTITIEGNLLLIQRTSDQLPFTVDATDGSGDTAINVIQNEVVSLANLPKGGFQGFVIKVAGTAGNSTNAPYFLTYNSTAGQGGAWVETVAPSTETAFLNNTMPVTLFCSAVDTFEIVQPTWLKRISGDGITSAFNPGFVGAFFTDISFFDGRLGLHTAATTDYSASNNPYNFWPASAQLALDTDPISIQLAASDTTAIVQRASVIDEQVTLWAQRTQFRLNSGVNPFAAQFIQAPPSTNYEFNPNCGFVKLGVRLYFTYEADNWASVYILQYQNGRAVGDTDITAHVPALIPEGTRGIAVSVPDKMLFVRTDAAPDQLYLYNYLESGGQVEQSAWNLWNLPEGTILWHGVYQRLLYVLLQRTEGIYFLTVPLSAFHKDPGGSYALRLDMRQTEASCHMVYNRPNNQTLVNFNHPFGVTETGDLRLVIRLSDAKFGRGQIPQVIAATGTSMLVRGDVTGSKFYVGTRITSSRQESPFFIRTATGHIPTERLTVKNWWIDYRASGYTRIEVYNTETGNQAVTELVGDQPVTLGADVQLQTGSMRALVDSDPLKVTITLINDSPYPSQWTATNYEFESVERATPMLTPYGGPVT